MIGEIIKILEFRKSRNGNSYMRIFLKMENGEIKKTDICPGYRNFSRWRKVVRIGNKLFNLRLKDDFTIDADSYPRLLEGRRILKDFNSEEYLIELSKLGAFG